MKGAADLVIAATCINNDAELVTNDGDFKDVAGVSDLRIARR